MAKAANPMIDMLLKSMGLDQSILKQAADIGEAFNALKAGQAELHAKADRQTEMLWTIQIALGIAPQHMLDGDMAKMIADESRKHMGDTIMAGSEYHDTTGGVFGPGIVAQAYVKLEELLKIREGVKLSVYRDTRKRLTVGIGHLVLPSDELEEGDEITPALCDELFRRDARTSMVAALQQMAEADIREPGFIPWLASVNFQLGTNWNHVFYSTWPLIVEGHYAEAAAHVRASDWHGETPVRAEDFARALLALPAKGTVRGGS